MAEVLIAVEHVSKKYCRDLKRSLWYGVQDIARDLWIPGSAPVTRQGLRPDEFWAVDGVSFEVKRGECLGLVGRNGAGNTTVLKMLNGLIKPDGGRIRLTGRLAALIALGAGFNPVLTGRENVYVNGSILGFSAREIAAKLDAIVEFAELESFIDAPVRGYSSGMQVRLGFAIAVVLARPDVLLLDEVLAVGDIGFTLKCLNAVRLLLDRSAVVFVTHGMQWVSRFCTQVLVMDRGSVVVHTPDVAEGIEAYLAQFTGATSVFGNDRAVLSRACLELAGALLGGDALPRLTQDDAVTLEFEIELRNGCPPVELRMSIADHLGAPVMALLGRHGEQPGVHVDHSCRIDVDVGRLPLAPGRYSFTLAALSPNGERLTRIAGAAPFQMTGPRFEWAPVTHGVTVRSSGLASRGSDLP